MNTKISTAKPAASQTKRSRSSHRKPAPKVFEPRDWREFLDTIPIAKEHLAFKGDEECFFRGHADRTWQLQPTLLRTATRFDMSPERTVELEGDLFWEFQAR